MFKVIKSYNLTSTERKIINFMIENNHEVASSPRITCRFEEMEDGTTKVRAYHKSDDRTWIHIIRKAA